MIPGTQGVLVPVGAAYPTAGLVQEYKFSSGAFLSDTSGQSDNLTQTGTVSEVAGKVGDCASFPSAIGNYLQSSSKSIAFTNLTLSLWFWVNAGTGSYQAIVERQSASFFDFALLIDPSLALIFFPGAGGTVTWGSTITTGVWHNAFVMWDGTTVHFSVDNGAFVVASSGSWAAHANQSNLGESVVGNQYPLNGKVDQFRLYNAAVDATGQSQLWNSGAGV